LAYYRLGTAYRAEGRLDDALEAYGQTITIRPDYVAAHVGIGKVYEAQGDVEKAVAQYRKMIKLNLNPVASYLALGDLYTRQGEMEEAIAAYQQAAVAGPTRAESHRQLALLYEQAGLLEKAIREWEIFSTLAPNGEQRRDALLQMLSDCVQVGAEERIEQIEAQIRPLIPNQMDVTFGGRVEFLGYGFNPLGDGQAYLDLYFKCLSEMDVDYTLWLHADVGEDSNSMGNGPKHLNFDHLLPTAAWREGVIYKDHHSIQAEPGLYHLSFGLWRRQEDSRLWRMDKPEQHHVYLGIFSIE
jgi:hypothetical protein